MIVTHYHVKTLYKKSVFILEQIVHRLYRILNIYYNNANYAVKALYTVICNSLFCDISQAVIYRFTHFKIQNTGYE